jgi:hypothetical protein
MSADIARRAEAIARAIDAGGIHIYGTETFGEGVDVIVGSEPLGIRIHLWRGRWERGVFHPTPDALPVASVGGDRDYFDIARLTPAQVAEEVSRRMRARGLA